MFEKIIKNKSFIQTDFKNKQKIVRKSWSLEFKLIKIKAKWPPFIVVRSIL